MRPLDLQMAYQQMLERGLSARSIRYTHAVLRSAMRQAVQWRLLLENPADGVKVPQQPRNAYRKDIGFFPQKPRARRWSILKGARSKFLNVFVASPRLSMN